MQTNNPNKQTNKRTTTNKQQQINRQLPCQPHALREVLSFQQGDLEKFLTVVYKSIGGQTSVAEKLNTLCYFETLCQETQAANLLVNRFVWARYWRVVLFLILLGLFIHLFIHSFIGQSKI